MPVTESKLAELGYYRGRVGLYWLLKALGIGPGDEVATQAFTCVAVPEGIMATGARPVYIDLAENEVNLCAQDLAAKLGSHVRAVIVQHTFGIPANMDAILTVTRSKGLPIIEDCCHSLASSYGGQTVGSFGVGAFYSHEWGKPLVTGIGGSLLVNDPAIRQRVVEEYGRLGQPGLINTLRAQAQYLAFSILYRPAFFWPLRKAFRFLSRTGLAEGNYNQLGEDGKPAEDFHLQMAPSLRRRLQHKLKQLHATTEHSERIAQGYRQMLECAPLRFVVEPAKSRSVYARFPVWVDDKPKLVACASAQRIEIAEWYATPVHPLTGKDLEAVHFVSATCPRAEVACRRIVSFPTHLRVRLSFVAKAGALFAA